jgi:hypothetical protein
MSTGFPDADAAAAFARQRRRQALTKPASRVRRRDDVTFMLPFEEVVTALGRTGERHLGFQSITLDSVVGTVDRRHGEFDRRFRPASARIRRRSESIAAARGRGRPMPPIDVFRVGELHFVIDGHHRVSVARAHGDTRNSARNALSCFAGDLRRGMRPCRRSSRRSGITWRCGLDRAIRPRGRSAESPTCGQRCAGLDLYGSDRAGAVFEHEVDLVASVTGVVDASVGVDQMQLRRLDLARPESRAPRRESQDQEHRLEQLGVALDRVQVQLQAIGDRLGVEQARRLGGEQTQQTWDGIELERVRESRRSRSSLVSM